MIELTYIIFFHVFSLFSLFLSSLFYFNLTILLISHFILLSFSLFSSTLFLSSFNKHNLREVWSKTCSKAIKIDEDHVKGYAFFAKGF